MSDFMWSASEKKVTRRVFEAALQSELAEVLAEFKAKAVAVTQPNDLWSIEEYLRSKQREIDGKYDCRQSR